MADIQVRGKMILPTSGDSSRVDGRLFDAGGGSINVKARPYYAIGDGGSHPLSGRYATLAAAQAVYPFVTALTDEIDYAAIQLAANSGKNIFIPEGTYVLNKGINATDKPSIRITGGGRDNTIIISTGSVVIDFTGSPTNSLENLTINGSGSSCAVGILYARSDTNAYSEHVSLKNVRVSMPHTAAINSGRGTVGIYQNAAELFMADNVYILADTPLVDTNTNFYNINSAYTSRTSTFTSNGQKVYRQCTFSAFYGHGIVVDGSVGLHFDHCYIISWTVANGGFNTENYAIRLRVNPIRIKFNGLHVEEFPRVAYIYTTDVKDVDIEGTYYSDRQPAITFEGFSPNLGGWDGGTINLRNLNSNNHQLFSNAYGTDFVGIRNLNIRLDNTQYLTYTLGDRTGLVIRSKLDSPIIDLGTNDGSLSAIVYTGNETRLYGRSAINSNGYQVVYAGLANTSSRPAISSGRIAGEINGANTLLTLDDGFLRISSGGGTSLFAKAWIDISGFSNVADMDRNIVLGTSGVERMRIDNSGHVTLGSVVPNGLLNLAASTTASGGIYFGTDTNLYRSAADTVKTDDALIVSGKLTASALLDVTGEIVEFFTSAATTSGGLHIKKRGTTGDINGAVSSGSELGYHSFSGWDGTTYGRGGYLFMSTAEAWTSTAHGTNFSVATTPIGSVTNTVRLNVSSAGQTTLTPDTNGIGLYVNAGGVNAWTIAIGPSGGMFQKLGANSNDPGIGLYAPLSTSGATTKNAPVLYFWNSYWNGSVSSYESLSLTPVKVSTIVGDNRLLINSQLYVQPNTNTYSSGLGYGAVIATTWNQTSGAGSSDLLIARTNTAVGTGSHTFIDAQLGGVSQFSVATTGRVTSKGLNAGFSPTAPSINQAIDNVYFPRYPDIISPIMLDYQDSLAWYHKKSTVTITPAFGGTAADIFKDDANFISWAGSSSPFPIVIEIDATANPIPPLNSVAYNLGLVFRSSGASAVATNIQIELWDNTAGSYTSVYNSAVTIPTGYYPWISPSFNSLSGSSFTISKAKITLTGTNPVASGDTVRIQRAILYHSTQTWNPWHLNIAGGTVYGSVTLGGDANAKQLIVKGNSGQSVNLQEWQNSSGTPLASVDQTGVITAVGLTSNISTQKVEVAKAGTLIGTRKRINLIEGSNVTITTSDNSGSDRMDVTIATSVGMYTALIGDGASTVYTITQATHGRRADRSNIVQVTNETSGDVMSPPINKASNGDVAITVSPAPSGSSVRVSIIG